MSIFSTITAKQIQYLQGGCYCTARKEWHRLRDVLGLAKHEPLRLRHVASVWDVPPADMLSQLN